jgi:hypothetical protein
VVDALPFFLDVWLKPHNLEVLLNVEPPERRR